MKLSDFIDLTPDALSSMSRSELAKVTRVLADAANKRVVRLEKADISSPAYLGYLRSGGKFSTKGKNVNQLRSEYIRARAFLNAKTSTIKGANKFKAEMEKRFYGILTPQQTKTLWTAFHRLEEIDGQFVTQYYRYVLEDLHDTIIGSNDDIDYLVQHGENTIDDLYRQKQNNRRGIGDMFDI